MSNLVEIEHCSGDVWLINPAQIVAVVRQEEKVTIIYLTTKVGDEDEEKSRMILTYENPESIHAKVQRA